LNILYTNFHPRNGGGHVTYIVNLARTLGAAGQGHRITVATPGTSRLYRYAGALAGVRVIDLPFVKRAGAILRERAMLRRLIVQERFDIVHANGSADHRIVMLAALGLPRATRPRIVLTKHNVHPMRSPGNWLRARLGTDRVIAVSDYVAALLRDSPYADCGIVTVRHGVDTQYFAPSDPAGRDALRDRYFGPRWRGRILLGSSGGTDYDKGWLDLLAGIARLPAPLRERFMVLVAGDPPNPEKLARVRALGLESQVVFPGLLDDVRPVLDACHVGFVLSHREALSFACREVMSLGLPALVSNAGGLPENVLDRRDGWIVPVADCAAIEQVLRDMLDDPDRIAAMGAAARDKSVREFGLERFGAATLAVYQDVLR
jgi:glycosyltransferase involved in cell wall biosynthesis